MAEGKEMGPNPLQQRHPPGFPSGSLASSQSVWDDVETSTMGQKERSNLPGAQGAVGTPDSEQRPRRAWKQSD